MLDLRNTSPMDKYNKALAVQRFRTHIRLERSKLAAMFPNQGNCVIIERTLSVADARSKLKEAKERLQNLENQNPN